MEGDDSVSPLPSGLQPGPSLQQEANEVGSRRCRCSWAVWGGGDTLWGFLVHTRQEDAALDGSVCGHADTVAS